LDIAGNLERKTVLREKPEPVAAAGARQLARLEDDPAAGVSNLAEQRIHIVAVRSGQRNDVDACLVAPAQTDAVELSAAFGCEVPHASMLCDLPQTPYIPIERPLRLEVRHAVAHVSNIRHSRH